MVTHNSGKDALFEQMDERAERRRTTRPGSASRRTARRCPKRSVLDYRPPKIEHTAAIKACSRSWRRSPALGEARSARSIRCEKCQTGEKHLIWKKRPTSRSVLQRSEASRLWYETDAELRRASAPLRKHLSDLRRSPRRPKKPPRRAAGRPFVAIKSRGGARTASRGGGESVPGGVVRALATT